MAEQKPKERAVDPAPVQGTPVDKEASAPPLVTVKVVSSGGAVQAPSGATFVLAPGTTLKVQQSDAKWLAEQGYTES